MNQESASLDQNFRERPPCVPLCVLIGLSPHWRLHRLYAVFCRDGLDLVVAALLVVVFVSVVFINQDRQAGTPKAPRCTRVAALHAVADAHAVLHSIVAARCLKMELTPRADPTAEGINRQSS